MPARAHVELLAGDAPDTLREIAADFALLDEHAATLRVWSCRETVAVLGISRDPSLDLHLDRCEREEVAVLRRSSGGGTVLLGPGTLQYAILMPHESGDAPGLDFVKHRASRLVIAALADAGVRAELGFDVSGDLRLGDRKIGGVALRRRRHATLLHGSILVDAELARIEHLLRHPPSEPAWRAGRPHREFLANVGAFDRARFCASLVAAIGSR